MKIGESREKRLYTVQEAALYLGRSVYSMRSLIWTGRVPVVQHGRRQWIDLMDLDRYIQNNKINP